MPTVGEQLLGDIVISLPTAQASAEYGHSLARGFAIWRSTDCCICSVQTMVRRCELEEEILQQVGLARHA